MIWLLLTLPASIDHPPQRIGTVEATLTVSVPERVDRFSPPRVRLEVRIQGTGLAEVEDARLGEEVRSWQVKTKRTQQTVGDRLEVTQVLDLEQSRPGLQVVPGVRVRIRQADATWHQFEWPNPMGDLQANIQPDLSGEIPTTSAWVWLVPALVTLALVGLLAVWMVRRRRRPMELSLLERTRRQLRPLLASEPWQNDPREAATRLSVLVRVHLSRRLGLDFSPRTVAECLAGLQSLGIADAELARLLQWCDAARFGDGAIAVEDARSWVVTAERVLDRLELATNSAGNGIVPVPTGSRSENSPTRSNAV